MAEWIFSTNKRWRMVSLNLSHNLSLLSLITSLSTNHNLSLNQARRKAQDLANGALQKSDSTLKSLQNSSSSCSLKTKQLAREKLAASSIVSPPPRQATKKPRSQAPPTSTMGAAADLKALKLANKATKTQTDKAWLTLDNDNKALALTNTSLSSELSDITELHGQAVQQNVTLNATNKTLESQQTELSQEVNALTLAESLLKDKVTSLESEIESRANETGADEASPAEIADLKRQVL